jgi:hypothetical protein
MPTIAVDAVVAELAKASCDRLVDHVAAFVVVLAQLVELDVGELHRPFQSGELAVDPPFQDAAVQDADRASRDLPFGDRPQHPRWHLRAQPRDEFDVVQ